MNQRIYIDFLNKIEKLKCNTRHYYKVVFFQKP